MNMYTYKLSNFLFIRMLKTTAWIFALFTGLQVFMFWNTAKNLSLYRFEQVLEKAGIGPIFIITNVIIIIVFTVTLINFYLGSKSMYSVLSLPMKPIHQIISLVIPCVLNILILWCLQFAIVITFGQWLPSFFPKLIEGFEYMNNYTLLAIIRYDPISIIYPLSVLKLIQTILIIIFVPIAVIFSVFTCVSRRFNNFAIIFLILFSSFFLIPIMEDMFTLCSIIVMTALNISFLQCTLSGNLVRRQR